MKKFLIFAMIAVMLTGCGSTGASSAENTGTEVEAEVTIEDVAEAEVEDAADSTSDADDADSSDGVFTSFVSETLGYKLCTAEDGSGQMSKILYKTTDGGESFEEILNMTDASINYPSAMAFLDENTGIILLENHGGPEYIMITHDGCLSWEFPQLVDSSAYSYVQGRSISYDEATGLWTILIEAVSDEMTTTFIFTSTDWDVWEN